MAIRRLPGAVTLGLAPYGTDLPRVLAEARNDGHEVLLQIPMEPYDYPDINPGPKTLTVNASAAENMNRLHWLMSRLTTYVGVMNYMGARLTGDETALKPILAEVASRGLLFLDDGSSSGSRATEIPGVGEVLRADVVLDADTTPAAIDAKLKQLARDRPPARLRHRHRHRLPLDRRPHLGLRRQGGAAGLSCWCRSRSIVQSGRT